MTTTAADAGADAERRELSRGLLGALIAVCAWSTGTILIAGIDMGGLAAGFYRFAIFSVGIVVWMQVTGTPFRLRLLRDSMWGGLALGADIALFFSAIKLTSVVNATIIGALQPVVVGVVAAKFFGERVRGRDVVWSLVAIAGVFVVVSAAAGDNPNDWRGDLLAFGAMLTWSGYFIASKHSKHTMTSTEFTAGTAIWVAIICFPLAFLFGQDMSWPSWTNLALLGAMVLSAGVIGHSLMNWSLVRIPLWIGSTFTLLIPVFSALLAWMFLDEPVTWIQVVAMAVVIGALTAIVRGQQTAPDATVSPAEAQ
ncbi:MAG: DMT family transporter [Actinomycetota bacterium]